MMSLRHEGDIMHPFVTFNIVETFQDDRRRLWRNRSGRAQAHEPELTSPWR
jgi:hypothetical protein